MAVIMVAITAGTTLDITDCTLASDIHPTATAPITTGTTPTQLATRTVTHRVIHTDTPTREPAATDTGLVTGQR